jgi:ribonuclease HI
MAWVRRRYRGNKAWVEVDEAGAYVADERGLYRLRYKPEDDRTYSVRPGEVKDLDAADASPAKEAPPPAPPRPRRPRPEPAPEPAEDPEFEPGDDVPALAGLAIHAYTDGASSGNPGPAGSGVVLLFREHRKEISRYLGEATNNVAELTAVLDALRAMHRTDLPVRVHADSSYAIGVLNGSMRPKANRDLVDEIRREMTRFPDLAFVKVSGHSGHEHNDRADALARKAIRDAQRRK